MQAIHNHFEFLTLLKSYGSPGDQSISPQLRIRYKFAPEKVSLISRRTADVSVKRIPIVFAELRQCLQRAGRVASPGGQNRAPLRSDKKLARFCRFR
jgi:hypothetical protein